MIEEDTKYKKYIKYGVAIEKSIPWIKEQIENSKDGTIIMRAKDVGKEMGQEFEKKNPTSIYWGFEAHFASSQHCCRSRCAQ
jgi:hypothetical protein